MLPWSDFQCLVFAVAANFARAMYDRILLWADHPPHSTTWLALALPSRVSVVKLAQNPWELMGGKLAVFIEIFKFSLNVVFEIGFSFFW